MFYIDSKSITKRKKLPIVLLIIGIFFITIFGIVYFYGIYRKNSMKGEIIAYKVDPNGHVEKNGNYVYYPIYYFIIDGIEYTCNSSASSTKVPNVTGKVLYKENNPSECITDYVNANSDFLLLGVALGLVITVISILIIIKNSKAIKKVKNLTTNGVLIKGLPYTMTDTTIEGKKAKIIEIDYKMVNGTTMHLKGNPKYNYKTSNIAPYADLLIDPKDKNNYYIDFDIKYSGDVNIIKYNQPNQSQNDIPYQKIDINQNKELINNNTNKLNNIEFNQIYNSQNELNTSNQSNVNIINNQQNTNQNNELINNNSDKLNNIEFNQIYNSQDEPNTSNQSNVNIINNQQNTNQNIIQ